MVLSEKIDLMCNGINKVLKFNWLFYKINMYINIKDF